MSDNGAPTELSSWREIALGLFPFLARFRTRPISEGGALEIKSANGRTELEGGGRPASGKGHIAFRIWRDTVFGAIYVSSSASEPYVWTALPSSLGPPSPTDPGTPIYIAEGSRKVEIDG